MDTEKEKELEGESEREREMGEKQEQTMRGREYVLKALCAEGILTPLPQSRGLVCSLHADQSIPSSRPLTPGQTAIVCLVLSPNG